MKPSLLFTMLSVVCTSPSASAKSELETLRSRCTEQERQIHQLEEENTKLRSGDRETRPTPAQTETIAKPTPKTEAVPAPQTPQPTGSSYTVKAGDNLEKIARKISVNAQKLAKYNGMNTNSIIHPGQKLKVPGAAAPSSAQVQAPVSPAASQNSGRTHTVRQGETFSSISKKRGISLEALVAANPKAKPSALRPGQVLNLSGDKASTVSSTQPMTPVAKNPVPATAPNPRSPAVSQNIPASTTVSSIPENKSTPPTPTSAAVTEKEKQSTPSASEKKIHAVTIDGEMTYGEFATKHGTNAERLNALNGLDLTTATVLAKGSELYVPAKP